MSDDLSRQLRTRLAGLEAAGIEWLPRVDAPLIVPSTSPASESAAELPADPDSPVQRLHELTVLADRVRGCTRCPELAATRTQTVFGVGPPGVDLCFVGEAPGADEDARGEPFVGAAGQLLNRIITACGMKREEVYICNILKCRPPGNRDPQPDEVESCSPYLWDQIDLIAPKVIATLGNFSTRLLLGRVAGISRLRGQVYPFRGSRLVPTYHPAALLRGGRPGMMAEAREDFRLIAETVAEATAEQPAAPAEQLGLF